MATDDIEDRLSALERGVAQLREQQGLIASDAAAARVLASGADHDVSEVRAELRAHTSALNALRETQLEQGRRLDRVDGRLDSIDGRLDRVDGRLDGLGGRLGELETQLTDGFATVGAGMAQIVVLLEGAGRPRPLRIRGRGSPVSRAARAPAGPDRRRRPR